MSVVPYNTCNEIVYHDPSQDILVLHNQELNSFELVNTFDYRNIINNQNLNLSDAGFQKTREGGTGSGYNLECPNCGYVWGEATSSNNGRFRHNSRSNTEFFHEGPRDMGALKSRFMHDDYFKLLGKLSYENESFQPSSGLPESIFNQGYFERFFIKIPPYNLGSGSRAHVFKVHHVLSNIKLGTYAVKRICIGDKVEFLEDVLNEVLILYEISAKGANEHNLIRYNHVWLELGDIKDVSSFVLPCESDIEHPSQKKVPFVFILQQYCDGGNLENLVKEKYGRKNESAKEKIEIERLKRRRKKSNANYEEPQDAQYLHEIEIWKFFYDVAIAVNYLHGHGILHCDLKPSNCLLDVKYTMPEIKKDFKNEESLNLYLLKFPRVLVSDFGEGKFTDKFDLSGDGLSSEKVHGQDHERKGNTGTLEFTAPELWLYANFDPSLEDKKHFINNYTFQSDIYSLGLILCWLCVGTLPFDDSVDGIDDPNEIKRRILDWYYDLTAANFHLWFSSKSRKIRGYFLNSSITDLEKLIYLLIKGNDNLIPQTHTNRLDSGDVLWLMNAIKHRWFIREFKNDIGLQVFENLDLSLVLRKKRTSTNASENFPSSEKTLSDEDISDDENTYSMSGVTDLNRHQGPRKLVLSDSLPSVAPALSRIYNLLWEKSFPLCYLLILYFYDSAYFPFEYYMVNPRIAVWICCGIDLIIVPKVWLRISLLLISLAMYGVLLWHS